MQDFRNLRVWQQAHGLVLDVYRITSAFPSTEQYSLVSQMRRAAISIPANIAEGCGRGTDRDFARFLQIASGSASELDYFLLLAHDLGYVERDEYQRLQLTLDETRRMLSSFLVKLRAKS